MIKIKNYIDGKLTTQKKDNFIDVYNPSIGKIYALCPNSSSHDLKNAISSAKRAFPAWSNLSYKNRSKFLF